MTGVDPLSLSVVVPTYNEEERVEACLASIFEICQAAEAVGTFEVILVDSNSTDRTVERATDFPITVVEIPDDDLTTPGAGRYVGTHYADGEVVLFVDGDMKLAEGWLPEAIAHVRADGVAAADGHLDDVPADATLEERDSVRGVALYDADALASVGGFDPFLESLEDIHLGYELNAAGYRLVRLPAVAAHHPGSDMVTETFRRWNRGYSLGNGQAIRKSLSSPRLAAKHVYRIRHRLVIGGWLGVGVGSLATGAGVLPWLVISAVGFGSVAAVRGSVSDAAVWIGYKVSLIAGLVVGLFDEPKPRDRFPIERVEVLTEGPVHDGSTPFAES